MTSIGNIQNRLVVPTGPRGTEFYIFNPLKAYRKSSRGTEFYILSPLKAYRKSNFVAPTGPRGTEFYILSPLKPTEKTPVVLNFTFYAPSKNHAPTMPYIAPAVVAPTVYLFQVLAEH